MASKALANTGRMVIMASTEVKSLDMRLNGVWLEGVPKSVKKTLVCHRTLVLPSACSKGHSQFCGARCLVPKHWEHLLRRNGICWQEIETDLGGCYC